VEPTNNEQRLPLPPPSPSPVQVPMPPIRHAGSIDAEFEVTGRVGIDTYAEKAYSCLKH
jgi:hypothetical protein